MSRFLGLFLSFWCSFCAMGFAAANAGHRVTLSLGLFTLYQVPVTLVAFSGLFLGMVIMFAAGVHSDLKVRRILRERLADESRQEQSWIDRHQQDLFSDSAVVRGKGTGDGPSTHPPSPPGKLRRSPGRKTPHPRDGADP